MTNYLPIIIEITVAVLLVLTIAYCVLLNRRLKLLRADEASLRATISELVTATEIAERAIAGLKLTVDECEVGLGGRLRSADRFTADLDRSIAAGQDLLARLSQIVAAGAGAAAGAGKPVELGAPGGPPVLQKPVAAARNNPQAIAAEAQAFAERLRIKVHGLAA
jgi:hypothetical protein